MKMLGDETAGVWRRSDALKVVTPGRIRAELFDGHWYSPFPSVYTDGGSPLTPERWAFAGVLASGGSTKGEPMSDELLPTLGALTCARDAARVWGMPLIDDDDPATGALDRLNHDVAVWSHLRPLRTKPVAPDDEVHVLHRHRLALSASDVERLPSGLWLTTRLRTLFDLTLLVSHEALVCAIDHQLHHGDVSREELAAYANARQDQYAGRLLKAALDVADERAESPHETLTRLLLKPHWPALEPQVKLTSGPQTVARFDLADEELQLAVESDGRQFHSGDVSRARDTRRDGRTEAYGWSTERVTWWEVRCRQAQTRERLLAWRERRRRARAA